MKYKFYLILSIACCLALLACKETLPYQDTSLSAEERAKDLVKRLTLEEKVSLMQHNSPAIPRLGIKKYVWWNEALHGVARAGTATVFPQTIGMAASFNDDLLYDVFTAVSDEARAKHTEFKKQGELNIYQGLTFWTPNVNIFRDPRWGRGQETYGEDPYLATRMGINVVRGLQGPKDAKYDKLHACAKHYAVHSGPEWSRHTFNAENIDPRDLWETYLPAFKALVQKADVKEVMCAYNRYEGDPCCGSDRLLQQILRNDWGFQGLIVSDCWAINDFYKKGAHETEPDKPHAAAKAVITGTDLECGSTYKTLVEAIKEGLIDEETINRSLTRVMKARFELGEMDENIEWDKLPMSIVDSKEHRDLALKMAQESMVLLQNKRNILPLKKDLKVAVIGPNANDSVMQWGNYHGYPSQTTTLLEGIKRYLPEAHIIYDMGCDHTSTKALQSLFHQCNIEDKQGFSATYWNNLKKEGNPDAEVQITTPFHFTTAGATVFAPGINLENFTATYESSFHPTVNEEIVFSIETQGKATLYINDQEVAHCEYLKNDRFYQLQVEAGKAYKIRLEYSAGVGIYATLNFDFGRLVPINYANIVQKVKDADVILFAGGISALFEGEEMPVTIPGFKGGDRETIELPEVQTRMIKELKKTGKPLVFINFSGSSMALDREVRLCDAIIQAWYPGQAGGEAIASILFGDYNPAGRLPITFYKSTSQLPSFEDYSMKGRTYRYMTETPLFPFGHGLSYSTFAYGDAQLSQPKMKDGDVLSIVIPVSNTGQYDGEEVVQLYLRYPEDKEGPIQTLRSFKRVAINKGTSVDVKLDLSDEDFEWYDPLTQTMAPRAGEYEILYGGTSDTKQLKSVKVIYEK